MTDNNNQLIRQAMDAIQGNLITSPSDNQIQCFWAMFQNSLAQLGSSRPFNPSSIGSWMHVAIHLYMERCMRDFESETPHQQRRQRRAPSSYIPSMAGARYEYP